MKRVSNRSCGILSVRGILNLGALMLLTFGLVTVFAVLPILTYYNSHILSKQLIVNSGGFNLGGINGTGQVPIINSLPGLIDATTPDTALTRQGYDGKQYNLVFSDEFSVDGRTFWPGDDPYWEAVNLHYWATGDLEWYDPDAITTVGGNLQITITKEDIHDLDFRSGMLQSWNKFCFTGGYIEVSVSLPGSPTIPGFWPGAWTMGNLARAGYGATTDGTWPYSYQACDIGTLKNQTTVDGTGPAAALTSGTGGGILSYLPGQRLSSCTCSNEEHPGPNVRVGRGSPEIDIIEAQVTTLKGTTAIGQASQSAQFAPFDDTYDWNPAGAKIVDPTMSKANTYKGGIYQESVSVVTTTDQTAYQGTGGNFQKFGFEYTPGNSGSITWSAGDNPTWTLTPGAIGPNKVTQISQRTISTEPMYIILNLAISAAFETVDLPHLVTPNRMLIDYVRVYQSKGQENIGCSPSQYPTEDYINKHINAYSNPNLTTWAQAGYNFPKNSLQDTC
ncbi:family 16 glycoside hydrolase [Melampsora americana]|nr:family 16 glycoside hydrolase [Melampsora americana]